MYRLLNKSQIKFIAIIAMTFNHLAYAGIVSSWLYYPGLITFVIMAYFLVEGFEYTHSRKKYAVRLFFFAIVSQAPFYLLSKHVSITNLDMFSYYFVRGLSRDMSLAQRVLNMIRSDLNVMFTLFLGFLLLCVLSSRFCKLLKTIISILLVLLSFICDWGGYGLICIYAFYRVRKSKDFFMPVFTLYIAIVIFQALLMMISGYGYLSIIGVIYAYAKNYFCILIALPILYSYNFTMGSSRLKYFFYVYYPLHLFIIWFMSQWWV